MKNIFLLITIALSVGLATGCNKDKKGGGSSVAVTPAGQNCANYTYRNGFYYDANGRVVTCNTGTNSCQNFRYDPNQGFYVDANNNRVNCDNNLFNNANNQFYPYNTVSGNGCSVYTHGVFYPVLMGNTMVCMGYTMLSSNFTQSYLNQVYMGGTWRPGSPVLASCYAGHGNCNCDSAWGGTLRWCWAGF